MSFAAEPYPLFVDDLLTALTGGAVREAFRFLPELAPFRLDPPASVLPNTVRVHGIATAAHRMFQSSRDFDLTEGRVITWRARDDGSPAAGATWPDLGTSFYVNYEHRGRFAEHPLLTDRNPGSVTRLLAESFAREYAVLSGQLEAVYKAPFVDTASGRDLDQVAALVGTVRRDTRFASGTVIFSRSTPAAADITVPAGTRLSTRDAPAVTFQTTAARTLRRGELSTEAPIAAILGGREGVVPANAVGVLHRPILGIERITNPQATIFAGQRESDEELRLRVKRAFQTAGRASPAALIGALAQLPGVREKDVRISEDPIARPGVIEVDVAIADDLDEAARQDIAVRARQLIDNVRPVGIRVLAHIDAPRPAGAAAPAPNPTPDQGSDPISIGSGADLLLPVDVTAVLVPTTLGLSADEKETLRQAGENRIRDFIGEAGLGEALVYNRLVSGLMTLENILDVTVDMRVSGETGPARKNILPAKPGARPIAGVIDVQVGAALVLLDTSITVALKGIGLLDDPDSAREAARTETEAQLRDGLLTLAATTLTPGVLKGLLTPSESYDVLELHYLVTYQDAGVRVQQQDVTLPLTGLEQLWIRSVSLAQGSAA
jgi:uncharacterized phage protein gp47/JayE